MTTNSRNIVIVDDEVALGQICQELLTNNGYNVTLYSRATEALNDLTSPQIDLLITDVGLADKSGWDLATELNSRLKDSNRPEVPVIFISGGILPTVSSKNNYYLEKPFSIYSLLRQVQTVFNEQTEKRHAG